MERSNLVIAISGKMQHGKNVIGQYLADKYKFTQAAFADKVKELCMSYDNSTTELRQHWNEKITKAIFPVTKGALDKVDVLMQRVQPGVWHQLTHEECYVTKPAQARLIMQQFAQGCREIYPDCWVNYIFQKCTHGGGRWAITDVRYKNEAFIIEAIENSQIWRVNREGIGPTTGSNHVSEVDLDLYPFEVVINNNGTIEELYKKVDKIMKKLLQGNRPLTSNGEDVY